MNETDVVTYVKSTAVLLGIPMDAARASRVASHLQRTAAMAALLNAANLSVEEELAEIYCPTLLKPNEYNLKQL